VPARDMSLACPSQRRSEPITAQKPVTVTQLGRVVFWMTGALLSFCIIAVSIRVLAGAWTVFEILAARSIIGVLILVVVAATQADMRKELRVQRFGLNLVRSSVHFAAQFAWSLAITLLPFAIVFALEFSGPAWVAILAVFFLGERLTVSRIGVVVLGITGILVILRPGLEAFQPAALLGLGAAMGFAVYFVMTKKLTAAQTSFSLVFWMNVMQLPMALAGSHPARLFDLGLAHIPAVLGIGVAGLTSHYCIANAFRSGDATIVIPLDFLRLPLIAIIGWLFFGERLDPYVFIGGAIILAGILWNLRAEARHARKAAALT
jgi:drug/metabolite transporter (DMT)-like permease